MNYLIIYYPVLGLVVTEDLSELVWWFSNIWNIRCGVEVLKI